MQLQRDGEWMVVNGQRVCSFLLKIVGDSYPLPGEDVHNINHELAWICETEEWVHLFYC